MPIKCLTAVILFLTFAHIQAQEINPLIVKDRTDQQIWVDSIYNIMPLRDKIGQLFMADISSKDPKSKTDYVENLVAQYHIGGVIFMKGGPLGQAKLTNDLQAASTIPLLVGMDAEWGLDMRLDSTYAFPWNMTLGAIKDDKIVEDVGRRIGMNCKRLGVNINFAPVVDININPKNPIIGNRSFGEDKENVTRKAIAFLKGMQSTGVLGSAKHFPGHGDTDQDSHKTLPTLPFSRERLDRIELYPYKQVINAGIASVMVAHLNVPALETKKGYPTSLSKNVVTGILQDSLNFNGLVFTDALNMKGASNFKRPGDIDLAAFQAGNDMLLISEDIPKAIDKIEVAYNKGRITENRLARSVKKILMAKYKVGLNNYRPVVLDQLVEDLNSPQDEVIDRKAVASSITVLRNNGAILPVKDLGDKKVAYVALGDDSGEAFLDQMRKYTQVDAIQSNDLNQVLDTLKDYNYVIIGFHRSNANPWKSYAFSAQDLRWIQEISKTNNTVLDAFVSPYALLDLSDTTAIKGIVLSYQNSKIAQEESAQMIFGAIGATGKLPVSLGNAFPINTSYETGTLRRLQYGIPEEEGMDSHVLQKVDSLVHLGIDQVMYPGAQVLIARHGKVVYEKAFGYHTYTKKQSVKLTDEYDLASMTKILATLPLLMERYDKGAFKLDDHLGKLLPVLKGSNKENISVKEVLSHYGRLKPWIPFYLNTMDDDTHKLSKAYYRSRPTDDFDIKVANDIYLRNDYPDSLVKIIADSDLLARKEYRYSDLSYFLFKKYLEDHYMENLDSLSHQHYYKIMGANHMSYRPLRKFDKTNIVPTENDDSFRMQQILGYVNDQNAALQGNIGGHAGLFSNANDVAKMMQMYLQNGYYGGKRFFSKKTMTDFNTCYYCKENVRRGVGFDKPQLSGGGPTCGCVSMKSFGHSGFTGTYTWADPVSDVVYVFLSNRTFPTPTNRKLITSDLRTHIQRVIQDSLLN